MLHTEETCQANRPIYVYWQERSVIRNHEPVIRNLLHTHWIGWWGLCRSPKRGRAERTYMSCFFGTASAFSTLWSWSGSLQVKVSCGHWPSELSILSKHITNYFLKVTKTCHETSLTTRPHISYNDIGACKNRSLTQTTKYLLQRHRSLQKQLLQQHRSLQKQILTQTTNISYNDIGACNNRSFT